MRRLGSSGQIWKKPGTRFAVRPPNTLLLRASTATAASASAGAGNENEACVGVPLSAAERAQAVAAVVTVTFDREEYLQRMLEGLLEVHGRDPGNA